MKLWRFLLFGVVYIGCSPKTETAEIAAPDSIKATGFDENNFASYSNLDNYAPASADTLDMMLIDTTCAVIINPTDDQIQKMEKEYGDDFATIADDYSFYQSEAIIKFDSTNIRIINPTNRVIKFKSLSRTWLLDLRKDGAPEWNIILFNVDKKPEVTSAVDVTYEKLNEYYFR